MGNFQGVLLTVVLSAAAVVFARGVSGDTVDITGSVATEQVSQPRFSVLLSGVDTGCTLTRSGQTQPSAPVDLSSGCDDKVPGLASVRSWREEPDGTVALADLDGKALLRLAIADGASWETYRPGSPMVSLVAE